ncbi:MAG: radical SAM family heme chaperone HemW [Rhodospirillaceae bacterium]|nr:radical SAM family heme chaperone HemW [Rhodospirillaceae bacterium]
MTAPVPPPQPRFPLPQGEGEKESGPADLAVYIHWPFCLSKCPYCDFNSHVRESVDPAAWQATYLRQIRAYAARIGPRRITSIFFGGGTPSLMPPETAGAIVDATAAAWSLDGAAEITLEANPAAVDRERFAGFAAAGVNRVSIGVQSFDDRALRFLGRRHSADDARTAIRLAGRYFDRSSFDLIYALPEQTDRDWRGQLRDALAEAGGHLSLYQLTIEPGTAFHAQWERGDLATPDEDAAGNLYETTQEVLEGAGLPAYEISNHARPGDESRHNLTYWRYGDYAGIGPGAHGRLAIGGVRHATRHHRAPEVWLERASQACDPMAAERGSAVVSDAEAVVEAVMMGMRTAEGVPLARLAALGDAPENVEAALDRSEIARLAEAGLLADDPDRLRATAAGRQRLNAVLAAILN